MKWLYPAMVILTVLTVRLLFWAIRTHRSTQIDTGKFVVSPSGHPDRSVLHKYKDAKIAWKRGPFYTPLPDVLVEYEMKNLEYIHTSIHYKGRIYGIIEDQLYESYNGKFHIDQPLDGPECSDEEVRDAMACLSGILSGTPQPNKNHRVGSVMRRSSTVFCDPDA